IAWGGHDWYGVSLLGAIGVVEEDSDLGRSTLTLALSGVDGTQVAAALGEHYQGRTAVVYVGALDVETMQLVADPQELKRGAMDVMEIDEGKDDFSVKLTVEDETAAWDRPVIRRYNDADQQLRYPGDTGLQFMEQMAQKEIVWRFN